MKTTYTSSPTSSERKWFIIDAEGKTLGRLATSIARALFGKDKATFTPHADGGDYVVVTNADKFHVTGKKMEQKLYHTHSGYLGGIKTRTLTEQLEKDPTKPLMLAVSAMLPKNKHRKERMERLKLFVGAEHTHDAQKPEPLPV